MKKRLLSLLVAVCLFIPCMFMLTACGKANVAGTYSVYSVSYNDITWTKAQYEANKESEELTEPEEEFLSYAAMMFESAMSFELKDDITSSSTMFGQTSTQTGTWAKDGDKITITMNPEEEGDEVESQELTYSDGKLVMSMTEEDMTITITLAKN